MLKPPGGPGEPDEWFDSADRFEAGLTLAKAGAAPLLVFTGGWLAWRSEGPHEGDVLRARAIERGVAGERIAVTALARNTEEEARAVAARLGVTNRTGRAPAIVLVTSAFHMRRAALLCRRAGLSVFPFPVDFRTGTAPFSLMRLLPRAESFDTTETALRELYGYLYYRVARTG
jgi:uncharacterized SAM-binding protein YcdF (DUF218 family)